MNRLKASGRWSPMGRAASASKPRGNSCAKTKVGPLSLARMLSDELISRGVQINAVSEIAMAVLLLASNESRITVVSNIGGDMSNL